LVLANGVSMFSCGGAGQYSLDVPLDQDGNVTLMVFAAGFKPYKEITHVEQPSPPPEGFSLSTLKSTKFGTVYTTQLVGSDSDGGQWTGSLSIANRAQGTLDGVLVTPRDTLVRLTYQGVSRPSGATSYIDMSGYTLGLAQQDGTTCNPAFPYQLPDFVEIGDFGLQPIMTCSNGDSVVANWSAEDGGNGNMDFVSFVEIRPRFGGSSFTTQTLTLDRLGNILAYKIIVSAPDLLVTLSGN